ncbi:hypothetical protein [Acidimangrovimonas sediminis]|uniref:hypothetical protein n=1 Tax=Acidimangrovimonas sediminis TaxID=2056283 RepID=UPI000C7FD9BE|nr:hypothetical protein [Acidimangrovimonas sediminis]
MDFRLVDEYLYWWPVVVRIPDPDPKRAGKVIEQTLKLQFRATDRDEAIAAQKDYEQLQTAAERADHEYQQLVDVCRNWSGVVSGGGSGSDGEVPFSAANLTAALQKSWFRIAVFQAYRDSLSGEEALAGTSSGN